MNRISCDMVRDCPNPITHIGAKGYVYCTAHAGDRAGVERVRKMTPGEIKRVEEGQTISYTRKAQRTIDLEGQLNYEREAHHLYATALQYTLRDEITHVCTVHDGQDRYVYRVCGETRADGGLVLITFCCPGQDHTTRVSYLEQEYQNARDGAHCSRDCQRHYEAMSKVLMHRNTVQDQYAIQAPIKA